MAPIPTELSELDPGRRFIKKLRLQITNGLFVLTMVAAAVAVVGLPYVQWDYTYVGPRPRGGVVPADRKITARYFGVTGWRQVEAIDREDGRLPAVLFVPVSEVVVFETTFPYVRRQE